MRTAITTLALLTFITLIAPTLPAFAAQGQLPPANWQAEGPHTHAEAVLSKLVQGDKEKGFKLLFSKGSYPQRTLEKLQFDYFQLVKKQGDPHGYEKVFEQRAGTSIIRLKYILLFKTQPQMFDLYYYNTGKSWLLKTFTISRDVKKIFER